MHTLRYKDLEFKTFLNKKWLKIFYHDVTGGVYFDNEEEALFSNTPQKFSILGLITSDFKINNYYEFVLEYPGIEGYNHWKQSIFPRDVQESLETSSGFTCDVSEGCSCSWTGKSWRGLSRSATPNYTFLDGSFHPQQWWFAIGARIGTDNGIAIPGPAGGSFEAGKPVYMVKLWIRSSQTAYHSLFCINTTTRSLIFRTQVFIYIIYVSSIE